MSDPENRQVTGSQRPPTGGVETGLSINRRPNNPQLSARLAALPNWPALPEQDKSPALTDDDLFEEIQAVMWIDHEEAELDMAHPLPRPDPILGSKTLPVVG